MASMLVATGAMAAGENATLTTKNYVDSGLRAVYQKALSAETKADAAQTAATNNANAITNIQTTLGDGTTSGLIKDVAELKNATGDISGKADQADLDALSGTVSTLSDKVNNATTGLDTKASQADLDALQQQVNGIDTTAYTGTNGVVIDANHQVGLSVPAAAANDGNAYVYKNGAWTALDVEDTWDASILTSGN